MTNIKLSPRLEKIAEKVPQGTILFDVGSDHAYLPCAVVQRGICPKAYAADLRKGPLQAAQKNIERYQLQGKVIPLLSNGLEALKEDATCLSIAGMGCHTAIAILEMKELTPFSLVIVQVNRKSETMREWIAEKGYAIVDEDVVEDEGFYYEIIAFNPQQQRKYSTLEILLGPCLLQKESSLRQDYWHQRMQEWKKIDSAKGEVQYQEVISFLERSIQKDTD